MKHPRTYFPFSFILLSLLLSASAGATYDQAISSLDLFPTFASAVGAGIPDHLDGVDLMPYVTDENFDAPQASFFWRQRERAALRMVS